jgi:hypothetical protein
MPAEFIAVGEPVTGALPDSLTIQAAKDSWYAVRSREEFTLVEARRLRNGEGHAEALVVDCQNDAVPTRNRVGIEYCERLSLVFHASAARAPEVWALRPDFPVTSHQNHVETGLPRSLCLYFEPWAQIRRTWTAQFHLNRVLWWLAGTANRTLHRPDQPLEQLYFESPFELVLPFDFREKVADENYHLIIADRKDRGPRITLIGQMVAREAYAGGNVSFECLALSLPSIVHGGVEAFPSKLGALSDQFERRGAPIVAALGKRIRGLCRNGRLGRTEARLVMLVLSVPLQRELGAAPEQIVEIGFIVNLNVADLGAAMGVLEKIDTAGLQGVLRGPSTSDTTYLEVNLISGTRDVQHLEWRDAIVGPLAVIPAFTPGEGRQMAGLADSGPTGTLAGFGALGSQMFGLWARAGWGGWTVIDPDYLRPHNLARHTALAHHVGMYKAHIATDLSGQIFAGQPAINHGIDGRADDTDLPAIAGALDTCDLVVDVTTDLGVPRLIASRSSVKRAISAFITPSGTDAVMLVEDAQRAVRLDTLEGQYYRWVISEAWGADHLAGPRGNLTTGAGCREPSAVIPNELIALHGANLAHMTRIRLGNEEGCILVWRHNAETGAVACHSYVPALPLATAIAGLKIVWDECLRAKLRLERARRLPNETGGVLVGYFDLVMGTVTIVAALSAPADSREEETGFVRGFEGLEESVGEISRRTANIVRYVGEWHSHPRNHSAGASRTDVLLLAHLASRLKSEGLPALMLIIGEAEERWFTATAQ